MSVAGPSGRATARTLEFDMAAVLATIAPTAASTTDPGGSSAGVGHEPSDAWFGHQRARTVELPDAEPLLRNLARCAIEVLAGARELDQVVRWVSEDVYRHLLKRVVLAGRARRVKGQAPTRPAITVGRIRSCQPRDGVIEATVMVHSRVRSRAVAIRLEGIDNRWRATAIGIL
jgi:hypothetical protein